MPSARIAALVASLTLLGSCGGDGGGGSSPAPVPAPTPAPAPAPSPAPITLQRVSPATPFAAACNGTQTGTLYRDAEVEPSLAIDPLDANVLVASWQQDRWSNGGAQGIVSATSTDGGATWTTRPLRYSTCAGGTVANGGDFDRASNPWTAISRNGTVQQLALAFDGVVFGAGSQSAMLVSRSTDHGVTWSATTTLVRDGAGFFNDKGQIAVDPNDARFVYATWDRLVATGGGPSMFARSVDNGVSWSAAAPIYDPGVSSQTIGNVIVVLPNGTLVDLFTQIDFTGNTQRAFLAVIRSTDHGATWSTPSRVADLLSVGTRDPQTGGAVRDASILAEMAVDAGGNLVVVWQDGRFSTNDRDAIAFSRSTDAGVTWSAPVAINASATATPGAAAFDPFVAIRADGTIAVAYYDFRDDTSDTTTLLTGFWLARSTDQGRTWTETRLAGPFDLDLAPRTDTGLFLGDYEALVATPTRFASLFASTNSTTANRTDIVSSSAIATVAAAREAAASVTSAVHEPLAALPVTDALRARSADAVGRALASRRPGS